MQGVIEMLRGTFGAGSEGQPDAGEGGGDAGRSAAGDVDDGGVDLYECPQCGSVLIEPAEAECSQCPAGTLQRV